MRWLFLLKGIWEGGFGFVPNQNRYVIYLDSLFEVTQDEDIYWSLMSAKVEQKDGSVLIDQTENIEKYLAFNFYLDLGCYYWQANDTLNAGKYFKVIREKLSSGSERDLFTLEMEHRHYVELDKGNLLYFARYFEREDPEYACGVYKSLVREIEKDLNSKFVSVAFQISNHC